MDYEVSLTDVESRPTAVVTATTTWQDFPALWGQLLGGVWDCVRAGGINRGCRNIMLYLDSVPNGYWVRRARISSRTRAASAWPPVAFMTAPTRAPTAASLPPRTLSATSGLEIGRAHV